MNNTIDFKTAKTIDSMSKKLDHIDDAHQLQTALAHIDRAQHEERRFKACRWPDHKYDSQHGKRRETYQHGHTCPHL